MNFSEEELREFSPKMKGEYLRALLDGKEVLRAYGILNNGFRFSHFMGQFGGETNGGEITRESLTYTSVAAIRKAWRARASKHSDEWIKTHLLRKPVDLGDWAYGGRMGNRKGTSDGFDYRGGGFLQTTGRSAVDTYCRKCAILIRPDILDDYAATLKFACVEWKDSGCNELADANDIMGISKAINTGSAKSNIVPNGMPNREHWFERARDIWWEAADDEAAEVESEPLAVASADTEIDFRWLIAQGSRIASVFETARRWLVRLFWGTTAGGAGVALMSSGEKTNGTVDAAGSMASDHIVPILIGLNLVVFAALVALVYFGRRYIFTAAKDGRYVPKGAAKPVA